MKKVNSTITKCTSLIAVLMFILQLTAIGGYAQPSTFKHTATSGTISENFTVIDNPKTNGNSNAILFVTHDFGSGPYITSPLGVYYVSGKWRIFNQDLTPMGVNAKFNILKQTPADAGVFIHRASSLNINGHVTTIDNPATNNNPNAKIILTQHWSGVYNDHTVGVYYAEGKWRIFNQDFEAMPSGAKFNVIVDHFKSFLHTSSSISSSHISTINDTDVNNKPNAFVFTTQNWGTNGPYNAHEAGVWYSGGRWKIYNEDRTPLPSNAKFNVIGFDLTPPNLSGYYSCNDGGQYYIRQIGNDVYWFGEHPSGGWANVFKGSIEGTSIGGRFYDVPKAGSQGAGAMSLSFNSNGTVITKTSGSAFGGSRWTKIARPSSIPSARPAGFHHINDIDNLNGRWRGNDDGLYYIRQIGNTVVWFGERNFASGRPRWANVAIGTRSGNSITLNWADVEKGNTNGNGTLRLVVRNKNELTRSSGTGGFGGSVWTRGAEPESSSILSQFGYGTMRIGNTKALGTRPLLVIRVEYSDMRFHSPHTISYYDNLFFGPGRGKNNPSVREYFKENSYNQFTFSKAGIVTVTMEDDPRTPINESLLNCAAHRTRDDVLLCPGVEGHWSDMIPKVIKLAESRADFDFKPYDRNGDKIITADELQIVIIGADVPLDATTAAHPDSRAHSGTTRSSGNPNFAAGYSYRGKIATANEGVGFATLTHEMSHTLGTYDLYGAKGRLNKGSTLMHATMFRVEDDKRSTNLDPYHRMRLGWIQPKVYKISDGGGSAELNTNNLGGFYSTNAKRPLILYDPTKGTQEYFMVEARRKADNISGYDNDQTGNGLKVWRIKTNASNNPMDNRIVLSGNNRVINSTSRGDDIAITDSGGSVLEIHNGENNIRNTFLRGDDEEGHDYQVYTLGPNSPLPGRGTSWNEADGDNTKMVWSNGFNSQLRLTSYDSRSTPGSHTLDWIVDRTVSTRTAKIALKAR